MFDPFREIFLASQHDLQISIYLKTYRMYILIGICRYISFRLVLGFRSGKEGWMSMFLFGLPS